MKFHQRIEQATAYLLKHLSRRNYIILLCVVVGLAAGMAAVLLKTLVHWVESQAQHNLGRSKFTYLFLFLTPLIGILLSVIYERRFLGGKLIKGVTKILNAIAKRHGNLDRRDTYGHIITSALTVGMGGSSGLEAPIVVTGSAIGSNIGQYFQLGYKEKTLLLACGASAGISAIFNAPIAGVVFAAEVLLTEIAIPTFVPLLISAASAAVLSQLFYQDRLFALLVEGWRMKSIPLYFLLGIFTGLVSVYMSRMTHTLENKLSKWTNRYQKAAIGGILLGLMIVLFPPLYGEGYLTIQKLMQGRAESLLQLSLFENFGTSQWALLIFLSAIVVLKVIATSLTIGSGGNGGIFAGSLFTGAVTGFIMARLVTLTGLLKIQESNFVAAGMAGVIAGVVHAPLTGIFLIAEITGGYSLFVPLMIVVAMSYFIAKYFEPSSVYTRPLKERGAHFQDDKDTFILSNIDLVDLVDTNIETVGHDMPIREVIEKFTRSKQNIFPVLGKDKKLFGIILLEDLKDLLFDLPRSEKLTAKDLFIQPHAIIQTGERLTTVMEKFDKTGAWKLPVVDEEKQFVGFVSKKRIFTKYRELLKIYSQGDAIS